MLWISPVHACPNSPNAESQCHALVAHCVPSVENKDAHEKLFKSSTVPCSRDNRLVASQHTLHEITQWPPKVLAPVGQAVLVDEQHVVFEASIEVGLQTELNDDRIVVAVDMCVDAVQALEHIADE